MNKLQYLSISAICMCIAGGVMLGSESIGIPTSKIVVPLMFALSGIFAWLFSGANGQHKLAKNYHLAQGVGMILFAAVIGAGAESLKDFLMYVTYFMLFFGFMEVIFGFLALNSSQKLKTSRLITRFASGFFAVIAAVAILAMSVADEMTGLTIAGAGILLAGLSFLYFSWSIRNE